MKRKPTSGARPKPAPKPRPKAKRSPARQTTDRAAQKPKVPARVVWLGGLYSAPVMMEQEGEVFPPQLAIWMQLHDRAVVALELGKAAAGPAQLVAALRQALLSPRDVRGQAPAELRVANPELALPVSAALRPGASAPKSRRPLATVSVGATPELDQLVRYLFASLDHSALEAAGAAGAGPSPAAMADLFDAAGRLHLAAPRLAKREWAPFGVTIEALGIEAACVGVNTGGRGLILFDSAQAFNRVAEALDTRFLGKAHTTLGARMLSFNLLSTDAIPLALRREAMARAWPLQSKDAYPDLSVRDPKGRPVPVTEADVRFVAALTRAVAGFVDAGRRVQTRGPIRWAKVDVDTREGPALARVITPHPLLLLPEGQPSIRRQHQPRRAVRR